MAIVRFSPWREIDSLQKEMNRLFDTFAGEEPEVAFKPAAEMQENHEAIDLKLEIPGLEPKDLDVQVTAEAVAIKGERRQENKTEKQGLTRSEFRYGTFQRIISLPVRVQNDRVKADYKDGILHLHLPKAEAEKNKVVKVNVG
ncbi:Hsp20/alpha crystallin family protein [Okeania sp.]|uniref:Hsp20/alpha crystallin family protein n=1 Tax=Okeania sp. TaxID=3100323 RepID=UPI002B4B75A8|nr:Hsp20/alpha crystallin family protein [Okeania sp.]MEB3340218.1 Hsp20/alpha crystallin family protein [Okeania sp.]